VEEGYSVAEVARMIRERAILLGEGTLYRWLKLLGYREEWSKEAIPELNADRDKGGGGGAGAC